jgi:transcription elongation GreA/GreB family factor
VPTTPCRREAVHSDAPLSSLVVLPNITVVLSDYDTAGDLREKAQHMKREEQEAYKRAKHARKKRDYNAEAATQTRCAKA